MFDISRAVKAKIEDLSKENLVMAQQKCEMAKLLLETATETRDNKFIADAVEEYLQAIEIYSKLTEPYMALAYISWVSGKTEDCTKLLNKVLEIEPGNQKAKVMLEQVNEETRSKLISSAVKKRSDKVINTLIKKEEKTKKDIFSKLSEMFSIKPKNSSNKARTPNNRVTGSSPPDVPVQSKVTDDFGSMIEQTRKTMFGNTN